MSDNPFIPEYVLKELASIRPQRLMYGEWLANECCECKSLEHVHLYRRKGVPGKITEYLCDSCYAKIAHYGAYEREWELGDQ